MPKPKHSFGKKSFEVNEKFIDREEAKQLYRDKLNHNEKEYNVLAFYGVGGIGKSKLKREICRLHKEENEKSVTFYLNLNAAEDRNMGNGILKLVDSCDNKRIDFKCFELAYALYFRKKNPGIQYGREKDLVTENTFVGIGLNILSVFDSGITGTAADIIEKAVRFISNRVIDSDVKEELKHFDEYSISEMEDMLPLFFRYDLQSYLEKHRGTKVLMVFDTFEALNENVIEPVHRSRNQRWVQEIIEYFDRESFPDFLTVIFGREELEWDEDWQPLLVQYKLEEFPSGYSEEYLKSAGITEPEIISTIIKSSRGYPLLLYLSLETYANMKNAARKPEARDFRGSYPEIIERFIYNLDKDTVEVLRLMSVPNYYNAEIFKLLIKEFNISFPFTEFEQFNKYSFVTRDKAEQDYYIHDLMRRGILEKSSAEIIQQTHQILLNYYSEKAANEVVTKNVLELFYHARKCMSVSEFNDWLTKPVCRNSAIIPMEGLKTQQKRGEQHILMQIINGILSDYKLDDLLIDLVNIYIDIVHLGGDYETAVDICGKYLAQFTGEEIAANEQLIKMRIRKIHHSMFLKPVDQLLAEAEQLADNASVKEYHEEYGEVLFLLGGNLGVLSGDFDKAAGWLEKSMDFAKSHNLDAFIQRTIRKQADILLYHNEFDQALQLINQSVAVNSTLEEVDTRYKIYLMGVLGEVYRKQNELDAAWHCYDIVDKKSAVNYLPGWQAHSYLGEGMVELQRGNYYEAEELLNKAADIYRNIKHQWGIINTAEAELLLKKYRGETIAIGEAEKWKAEADRMHYRYNAEFAGRIINGETPYLQLFFL